MAALAKNKLKTASGTSAAKSNARTVPASSSSFEQEARVVLTSLRTAMGRMLAAVPGQPTRPTDLKETLDIRFSLAWEAFKVAQATDPFQVAAYIPRAEAMAKLFDAAKARHVKAGVITALEEIYADFLQLVQRHAGERSTFDAMVAALGGEGSEQIGLKDRRAAFRVEANLWGMQARVWHKLTIGNAGPTDPVADAIAVTGCIGFHALRPVPPVPLFRRFATSEKHGPQGPITEAVEAPNVLKEFCSRPTPVVSVIADGAAVNDVFQPDGVGRTALIDCYVRQQRLAIPFHGEHFWTHASFVHTPCEWMVMDMLVPAERWNSASASVRTFGNVANVPQALTCDPNLVMPTREVVRHLGTSIDALFDPLLPRGPELVRYVLAGMGWSEMEFDIFRCVVRYPILHSVVSIEIKGQ